MKIYYISFGVAGGLILLIACLIRNCLGRRLYRNRESQRNIQIHIQESANEENNHDKEIEEDKKKIELLFDNGFQAQIYSKEIFKNLNTNCSICLEKFIDKKSRISITTCDHIFHFTCLKKWSEENEGHFKCPNCNYDFLKDEPIIIRVLRNTNPTIFENGNKNNIDTVRNLK